MAPLATSLAALSIAASLAPGTAASFDSCPHTPASMASVAETIGAAAKAAGFEVFVGEAG